MTLPCARALLAIRIVVSVAAEHASERLRLGSEVCAARHGSRSLRAHAPGAAGQVHLDRHVADQSRAIRADGADVKQPDAGKLRVTQLIRMSEQLVTATDAEYERPALGRRGQRLALVLEEVAGAEFLVPVLAAAHVVEVGASADPAGHRCRRRSARSRGPATRSGAAASAGCRGRRRYSSGPDTARRRAACAAQPPRITTSLPMCSSVAGIVRTPSGSRPALRRGLLQLLHTHDVERDPVRTARACAGCVHDLPASLEYEGVSSASHRRRLAEIGRAVDLGDVGQRRRIPSIPLELLKILSGRERDRQHAAAAQMHRVHARETQRARRRPPSSWIVCIGTTISGNERSPSVNSRASAHTVSTGRPVARRASSSRSSALLSSATTACPARASASVTRPVPAPTSSTGRPSSSTSSASCSHSGRSSV